MNRYELELAQWLHSITADALENADRLDPSRRGLRRIKDPVRASLLIRFEHIAREAGAAFHDLAGKLPHEVELSELHTEEPASWTRARTVGLK